MSLLIIKLIIGIITSAMLMLQGNGWVTSKYFVCYVASDCCHFGQQWCRLHYQAWL